MHDLARFLGERVAAGLKRRSLTTCSKWAEAYRVLGGDSFPGPWSFKWHPWLREMHDSEAERNVGQKSAQMGFTETVMNIVFFSIDVKGMDCLYVLPAQTPDASDFSAGRFNPALELSPHLANMFSDVKNVGHKRAGAANLYVRGSRSRSGLKSIPTGLIILDELDEMTQKNIPLAMERASGQTHKQIWMVSTATIHNRGINKYFLNSTQNHFHFRCPGCSRYTELLFPDCLVITGEDWLEPNLKNSHLICKECKCRLPHESKPDWLSVNQWVPSFTQRDWVGWHVNQLYSSTVSPYDLAVLWLQAQFDPAAEQEFYNSKLGLPHVVDGARITDDDLETAKRSHKRDDARNNGRILTMGVDVGKWLHYEIDEWYPPSGNIGGVDINTSSKCKVLTHGKVKNFEDLDLIMDELGINFCVMDANPETRKGLEFANRYHGRVRLCYYGRGVNGKNIHIHEAEPKLTVDRTAWLDLSLSRFKRARHDDAIMLPHDINMEYREHMKALVRVYETDGDGNPVGRYDKGEDDDHYAHARNYAEIAYAMAASMGDSEDISSVL